MSGQKKCVGEGCIEGWACPKCGQYEHFTVEATAFFDVNADGTDQCDGVDWTDDSHVQCPDCGWHGTVSDVEVPEEEWAEADEEEDSGV